ncbi:MAG: polysaccharide biosynthesis C-terminal domain-containing protein [Sphaerochaeta sp.]|nr:polysaccharide biosynthesis C-terminal domain-containing protein [Sphaerochaeta sp.]
MKGKRLSLNIIMSLSSQVIITFCAFVINNLVLSTYGSEANGLLQSVTRFLSIVTLIEGGFGGVIRASLYGPLYRKDEVEICKLYNSTRATFFKLGVAVFIYTFLIAIIFKYISDTSFSAWSSFGLVLVIGGITIIEYVAGISYDLILQADQKVYISSSISSLFYILRIPALLLLRMWDRSLLEYEFTLLILFIIKVFILQNYVRMHYRLSLTKERTPLENRWDGLLQHIAYTIHSNIDVVLITAFMTLKDVSVYSIYAMVVAAAEKMIKAISTGTAAKIGKIIASGNQERICNASEKYVLGSCVCSTAVFAAINVIIMDFIELYTVNVTDVNYINRKYAFLILMAGAVYCLRIPIKTIVNAAGHYKQTNKGAIIEASINFVLSLLLIRWLGIIGILLATLISMIYRTVDLLIYLCRNILRKKTIVIPIVVLNFALSIFSGVGLYFINSMHCKSYFTLFLCCVISGVGSLFIVGSINAVAYGRIILNRRK